jgi:hypothetical protein
MKQRSPHFRRLLKTAACLFLLGITRVSMAAPKPRWATFKSTLLDIQISVPSDWAPVKMPKTLAFRFDDQAGSSAGIGILKSASKETTIDQAADVELDREGHPPTWTRSNARVDNRRAIKLVGVSSKNPEIKLVHYYVEAHLGMYIIQCQATAQRWNTFGPIFATILSKLKFLS